MSSVMEALRGFEHIQKKTHQAIRIYDMVYRERLKHYKSLNSYLSRLRPQRRAHTVERLKQLNKREKHVLEILRNGKAYVESFINSIDRTWSEQQAHLKLIDSYYSELLSAQHAFLEQEASFLEGKMDAKEFKQHMEMYFGTIGRFSASVNHQLQHFQNPAKLIHFLEKNKQTLAKEYSDLLGFTAVFVGEFSLVHILNHSLPDAIFEPARILPWQIYAEFILICFGLTLIDLPARSWRLMKDIPSKTINAVASLL